MLILMGLIAAPYCWPYDQTIASPALLHGAYTTRSRVMLALLALSGVPVLGAIMIGIKITTPYYLFIAPAWLAWLLVVHALAKESGEVLTERSAVPLSGGSNQ